jgi:hypothetical protein
MPAPKTHKNHSKGRHVHKTRKRNPKLKSIKCSPKNKKDVLPYTCYTTSALDKLKTVWNARHPDQTINSNSPREIWEKLRHYMQDTCSTESCWLRHQCIKHDIDKSLWGKHFAPYSPAKWKENPKEWLTTVDIQKVMAQWEKAYKHFEFIGPSPIDYDTHMVFGECVWEELCKFSLGQMKRRGITKVGVIFNLDKHNQSGSHWVAVFIDMKTHKIYYFDSYGDPIPSRISKFCDFVKKQGENFGENYEIVISKKRHQYSNSECGMYSMYFLLQLLQGTPHSTFEKVRVPDSLMLKLRKEYFNSK